MPMSENLIDQVIAGIILLVAGAVIGQLIAYFRGRRGNRIHIVRKSQTPGFKLSEGVGRKLRIEYSGHDVDQLVMNRLQIWNGGGEEVKDIELKFIMTFEDAKEDSDFRPIYDVEPQDPDRLTKIKESVTISATSSYPPQVFEFFRPYLNKKRAFREEIIELLIVSNSQLRFGVKGSGPGWRPRFRDELAGTPLPAWHYFIMYGGAVLLAGIIGLLFLTQFLGSEQEDSVRSWFVWVGGIFLAYVIVVRIYVFLKERDWL